MSSQSNTIMNVNPDQAAGYASALVLTEFLKAGATARNAVSQETEMQISFMKKMLDFALTGAVLSVVGAGFAAGGEMMLGGSNIADGMNTKSHGKALGELDDKFSREKNNLAKQRKEVGDNLKSKAMGGVFNEDSDPQFEADSLESEIKNLRAENTNVDGRIRDVNDRYDKEKTQIDKKFESKSRTINGNGIFARGIGTLGNALGTSSKTMLDSTSNVINGMNQAAESTKSSQLNFANSIANLNLYAHLRG